MKNQKLAPAPIGEEAPLPVLTNGHHSGLRKLRTAFAEARPVAIIIGDWESGPSYLVDRFLDETKGDVVKARVTNPGSEDDAAMHEVARAVGFDLQDASLASLEKEFKNFLSFQKHNNRRTIICFEEIQHDSKRVLEIALRLAELETKERFGLMLILSGPPKLNTLLGEPPFDAICAYAGQRIALGPFTLIETRENILRGIEAAGIPDIGQVFEYDAITRIHEICAGVPEKIDTLCCKCIQMVAGKENSPITAALASEAANLLWQKHTTRSSRAPSETIRVNNANAPIGRLIARMHGVIVKEQGLNNGHVLIGRDSLCDISLTNRLVSRHHALVVTSATGVSLIDLGSTNGTFVGDRQIQQSTLQNGDVITIGNCKIAYVAGDNR